MLLLRAQSIKACFPGVPPSSLPHPSPPAYAWLLNFACITLTAMTFSDAMNNDYFVFNRLEDGWHENNNQYFRYHVPSGDDNRGRCKSWR